MSCHFEGDSEGHLHHTPGDGQTKSTVQFKFLTSKNGKGKVGIENLGSIVIHTKMLDGKELENKPLAFTCTISKKKYTIIPYKLKIESKKAAESYNLMKIPAHAITLKNFIDLRNGKIFLTRTLTYYVLTNSTRLTNQVDQFDKIKLYIYGIPRNKFGYLQSPDTDIPLNLQVLEYQEIEDKNLKELTSFVNGLTGRNYIRGRTLLTALELQKFKLQQQNHLTLSDGSL